jgi:indolepyruvate ferredoxin oxidoreductase
MWKAFKVLAKLKGLRGGPLDVFGRTAERRMERALIAEYRQTIAEVLARLTAENYDTAVLIAALPDKIRGFGHVKEKAVAAFHAEQARLLSVFGGSHQHAA